MSIVDVYHLQKIQHEKQYHNTKKFIIRLIQCHWGFLKIFLDSLETRVHKDYIHSPVASLGNPVQLLVSINL